MKKVTGIGGVFFRAGDPEALREWYQRHLGVGAEAFGHVFTWREDRDHDQRGYTVWSPFKRDSEYFGNAEQSFMVNYRVADLEGLLRELSSQGVTVCGEMVVEANGKFAWILDPDGHRVELWEPLANEQDPYLPAQE